MSNRATATNQPIRSYLYPRDNSFVHVPLVHVSHVQVFVHVPLVLVSIILSLVHISFVLVSIILPLVHVLPVLAPIILPLVYFEKHLVCYLCSSPFLPAAFFVGRIPMKMK